MHQSEIQHPLDRIYLSNVPDYTGLLNALLHFLPKLKDAPHAILECRILLAMGHYHSAEEYIYSAARTKTAVELRSVLGVESKFIQLESSLQYDYFDSNFRFQNAKLKKEELVSQEQLTNYLVSLFLAIVDPVPRKYTVAAAEYTPLTMATFVLTLSRLHVCFLLNFHQFFSEYWISCTLDFNNCR